MLDASYVQLSDGRQVGYQEYGDREGRPVFFFHGWIGSRLDFGPNDDIARELGMRVIAVDRPGCGSSDFQQDRRLLDWPDDVSEVADALGFEQFAICGHSFGGPTLPRAPTNLLTGSRRLPSLPGYLRCRSRVLLGGCRGSHAWHYGWETKPP
jgi:pimeloyl-ACP methyl ester carboxylesterase